MKEENQNLSADTSATIIAMRVALPEAAHSILRGDQTVTIEKIYTLRDDLTTGRKIFIALGGDKGKKEIDWKQGFYALAHVKREPYDVGYMKGNRGQEYFKIDIDIDCTFSYAVPRDGFLSYPDAYDAPFIGPELHRDVTQVICSMPELKAIAVIRGILDKMPEMKEEFDNYFSEEFMARVYDKTKKFISIDVPYGMDDISAMRMYVAEGVGEYTVNDEEEPADPVPLPYNRILFGAPGTGKSYQLKEDQAAYFPSAACYERVTFHPAYSYAQFFGTYKPVSEGTDLRYEFVPGPFLRVLLRALQHPAQNYLLIIEEINRADVAAVFGDVFQLLDRDAAGRSEYDIDIPEDLLRYLQDETNAYHSLLHGTLREGKLYIPGNLYLWATMNSADQGVMPLDTAFKRRWQFTYIGVDYKQEDAEFGPFELADGNYSWLTIRARVNQRLKVVGDITEDRLLGPFFLRQANAPTKEAFCELFKSKVLMYLYQDVAKYAGSEIFDQNYTTYSELCAAFDAEGMGIFPDVQEG